MQTINHFFGATTNTANMGNAPSINDEQEDIPTNEGESIQEGNDNAEDISSTHESDEVENDEEGGDYSPVQNTKKGKPKLSGLLREAIDRLKIINMSDTHKKKNTRLQQKGLLWEQAVPDFVPPNKTPQANLQDSSNHPSR
jgi:hypothetical protein